MEEKPFLTRDNVHRIRATVDADYERDVKNLTDETTDDLRHIQVAPPAPESETSSGEML